jgi:hypothetical protein
MNVQNVVRIDGMALTIARAIATNRVSVSVIFVNGTTKGELMKLARLLVFTLFAASTSCSRPEQISKLADSRPYPGAFDTIATLFYAGTLPDWNEIAFTHYIVGTTVYGTSKDTATDLSAFFYLDPISSQLYIDSVFYTGVVVNWNLQDYIKKVTPVIRAGNLLPLVASSDGTAYSAGYLNLVQAYYRTAVDSEKNRWLIQSRTCIAASGCNLPDGQGNTRHFEYNELFAFSLFSLQ